MEQLNYQAQGTADLPDSALPPRLLLTVEEAADRIGVCRSNMFKLIARAT